MANRYKEQYGEDVRKAFKVDLHDTVRLMDGPALLRNVDEDAVNKLLLSNYDSMRRSVAKHTISTGDADDMEKYRAHKGDYRLDATMFNLEDSVERIYFDYFGHGYYDPKLGDYSPVVNRPGAPYCCPCGRIKMAMNAKTFPEECPACHRRTPIGELVDEGVMRR